MEGVRLIHECTLLWLPCNSNLGVDVPNHGSLRTFTSIESLESTTPIQCSWRTGSDAFREDQELPKCGTTFGFRRFLGLDARAALSNLHCSTSSSPFPKRRHHLALS
ncbi:hypothetical protein GW17_00055097 [Ensete ventricosum]|nr:hypothetical protein GW17_00055097 [Ensete ventricosum]